jgi:hypothetical protein
MARHRLNGDAYRAERDAIAGFVEMQAERKIDGSGWTHTGDFARTACRLGALEVTRIVVTDNHLVWRRPLDQPEL